MLLFECYGTANFSGIEEWRQDPGGYPENDRRLCIGEM